jgi:hypothetical protein
MASLTGRLVDTTNMPVWELGVVVESQEYDGCAKSYKYKAVERHKQANEVLRASSLGKLKRVFTNPRENPRLTVLICLHTYRFKSYE